MELIKIGIPIFTFILGVVLTYFLKEVENSKKKHRESIEELARLTNEWYNQLFSLTHIRLESSVDIVEQKVVEYSQNRLVLPSILRHLEILKCTKKYDTFCKAVDEFLLIVTDKRENNRGIHWVVCAPITVGDVEYIPGEMLDKLLVKLDDKMQQINILAGKHLSKL